MLGTALAVLIGLITFVPGEPFVGILVALIFIFANYISTQFFISVIDLLIKIEKNTRNN